jgi:hypothetical protein
MVPIAITGAFGDSCVARKTPKPKSINPKTIRAKRNNDRSRLANKVLTSSMEHVLIYGTFYYHYMNNLRKRYIDFEIA